MSFDYDLFVIDSENKNTKEYQLRDCLKDALERLNERLENLENGMFNGEMKTPKLMEEERENADISGEDVKESEND